MVVDMASLCVPNFVESSHADATHLMSIAVFESIPPLARLVAAGPCVGSCARTCVAACYHVETPLRTG